MSPLLQTIGLERVFGPIVAASNINVSINEGEVIGVIGTNGAGKTSFVNMVTGYLKPSAGKILFKGQNIAGKKTRHITRLGIGRSFQIPQLFFELTALENVMIALSVARNHRLSMTRRAVTDDIRAEAMAVLQTFSIDHHANKNVSTLPQGVRKLIDIAMAMAMKPNPVFLDEPTSGVSAHEKMEIMHILMAALRASHTTVLFIEHDMEIVETFSPRVIAFHEGTILADGQADQVLVDATVRECVIGAKPHKPTFQQTGQAAQC